MRQMQTSAIDAGSQQQFAVRADDRADKSALVEVEAGAALVLGEVPWPYDAVDAGRQQCRHRA